jgi:hypothetical protein
VTGLAPEVEPVELLVAPELVAPVELLVAPELVELLVAPELVEPVEPVAGEVAVAAAVVTVWVLAASAGSCPVTSTTVMRSQTAMKSATDPPTTRARRRRTRARRASLSLSPSSLVMA